MLRQGTKYNKYMEKDINSFAEAFADEHTCICEPFSSSVISTLKGMMKSESEDDGTTLGKFDLGYIPAKLHMIFLYFLRMNSSMRSLHARNINLKSDVIKYLMKDFTNLREFTLSFGQP